MPGSVPIDFNTLLRILLFSYRRDTLPKHSLLDSKQGSLLATKHKNLLSNLFRRAQTILFEGNTDVDT